MPMLGFELDEVTDRSLVRATAACPKRSSASRQDEEIPVAVVAASLHRPERFLLKDALRVGLPPKPRT
jgi:uncharacterized protein YcgI (DUF1989 family)